jgi:tetratricopeptide (TPR) repeat protein
MKLNPDYASAYVHYNSGLVKVKSGDNKGAIADFNQAIKHNPDPDYADAYYNRGIAKANLGDKQGAINDFRKAAKIYQKQNNVQDYQDVMNALKKLGAPN